jgi:hypothetical protein
MNRKLLIQTVVFMIITLVLLPSIAGAAPSNGVNAGVNDIQTMVNTVLTQLTATQSSVNNILNNLTALQTDVTTIKTTTATINGKVKGQPIRYEYYTTVVPSRFFNDYDSDRLQCWLGFSNGGDTPAAVSYTIYDAENIQLTGPTTAQSTMIVKANGEITIDGKQSKSYRYENFKDSTWVGPGATPKYPIVMIKITSDSPYLAPRLLVWDNDTGQTIDSYKPGDFQKVEIYS